MTTFDRNGRIARLASHRSVQFALVASVAAGGIAAHTWGGDRVHKASVHTGAGTSADPDDLTLDTHGLAANTIRFTRAAAKVAGSALAQVPAIVGEPTGSLGASSAGAATSEASARAGCALGAAGANAATGWQVCANPAPRRITVGLPQVGVGRLPSVDGPSVSLGQMPAADTNGRTIRVDIGLDPHVTGPSVDIGNPVVVDPADVQMR